MPLALAYIFLARSPCSSSVLDIKLRSIVQKQDLCCFLLAVNVRSSQAFVKDKILGDDEVSGATGQRGMEERLGRGVDVPLVMQQEESTPSQSKNALLELGADVLPALLHLAKSVKG